MVASSLQCRCLSYLLHALPNRCFRCHGPAILPGIIDQSTGKSVIAGKKVTGFMTKGEEELGALDTIKKWNVPTIESAAASAGAQCKSGMAHHVEVY